MSQFPIAKIVCLQPKGFTSCQGPKAHAAKCLCSLRLWCRLTTQDQTTGNLYTQQSRLNQEELLNIHGAVATTNAIRCHKLAVLDVQQVLNLCLHMLPVSVLLLEWTHMLGQCQV